MTTYQQFRKLFDLFSLKYKGINLNSVISRRLYDVVANPRSGFYHSSIKSLFRKYDVKQLCDNCNGETILFYQGIGLRRDQNNWCDYINNQIGGGSKVFYSINIENSFAFHPYLIICVFFKVFWILKESKLTIWQKFDIFSCVMPYCNTIKELQCHELKWVKKFVALLYPLSIGSLFTQYFKLRGVETIAIADGIFFNYGEDAPYDAVNYSDFISDKLLLWGNFSKQEYENLGINPNKLFVVGYPNEKIIEDIKNPNVFKKCCVLLARPPYEDADLRLLKVLSSFSSEFDFHLKLHPANNECVFKDVSDKFGFEMIDKSVTMDECIGKETYDFVIAVNTTAYYEALIKGLPCFRFRDSSFVLMQGYEDCFSNEEEFCKLLSTIRKMPIKEYQTYIKNMLQDTIGVGINNYKEAILK